MTRWRRHRPGKARPSAIALLRARLAVLVLVLLTLPAWAAPFDRFQLIMWQDATPAQAAGLKRLGFTGLKLTGSGGRIDPVKLAAARASGLPWYVENIATDFLSPYHRYTPGKPVTWLFEAAKARLRADPADTSVFLREPSLSDPLWLSRLEHRLGAMVRGQSGDHPLFYNLADEAGIGDLAAAWDADISPASLAAMRGWLRTQYPDLAALNRQWGSDFDTWDAIMPQLTDAALRRSDDNFSAWSDFKAWMDVAFARAVRVGTDAVHRADPTALAALEGGQIPGWGGYDYGLLAPAVDVMEIYQAGNAAELARAFNPNLIELRTSFASGPREAHAAWRHMLHGGRGLIVWDEHDGVVGPDGSPIQRGREIAALVRDMRAVTPALFASQPSPDPVAVLYSQASFRVRWILDQRGRDAPWWNRDAAREYEDNAWSAARRQVLRRLAELAVQPWLLTSAMLEAGDLRQQGVRVLILPHAIALSAREVDEIRTFGRDGGTVLADTEPALFDQHGRRRREPALADVVKVPEAMLPAGGTDTPDTLAAVAALLRDAAAPPRAMLLGPDGLLATGVEAQWLRDGDTRILTLQAATPWGAPNRIEVRLAAPASVEDLRRAGAGRREQRFTVALDPIAPTILRLRRTTSGPTR